MDTTCSEYENGTSLHIAAANLSVEAAKILLSFGADKDLLDDLARKPEDCVPDPEDFDLIPDASDLIVKMRKLLNVRIGEVLDGEKNAGSRLDLMSAGGGGVVAVSGRTALKAMGLKVRGVSLLLTLINWIYAERGSYYVELDRKFLHQ